MPKNFCKFGRKLLLQMASDHIFVIKQKVKMDILNGIKSE